MGDFDPSRREFMGYIFAGGVLVAAAPLAYTLGPPAVAARQAGDALRATPASSLGPFYKRGAPARSSLREPGYGGPVLGVSGVLRETSGKPAPGTVLDLFHADPSGAYDMEGFRYRAQVTAGDDGAYAFETAPPGAYGGRPQHIHFVIRARGGTSLVTQLYFADDPFFGGDPTSTYRRDSLITDAALIRPVERAGAGSVRASVVFDITLPAT
jgi:protocatechuate 3,4-dioxygenase beta subunit